MGSSRSGYSEGHISIVGETNAALRFRPSSRLKCVSWNDRSGHSSDIMSLLDLVVLTGSLRCSARNRTRCGLMYLVLNHMIILDGSKVYLRLILTKTIMLVFPVDISLHKD